MTCKIAQQTLLLMTTRSLGGRLQQLFPTRFVLYKELGANGDTNGEDYDESGLGNSEEGNDNEDS